MTMKKSKFGLLAAVLMLVALSGWGCGQKTSSGSLNVTSGETGPSGPKPLQAAGLSAEDLTKKINFVAGNVVVMNEKFYGKGAGLAKSLGFGDKEVQREIVIKRFAPGHLAELEWKTTYKNERGADEQKIGALVGADLQSSHELYLPALWPDGVKNAYATGLIWLSADVYENLSRSGLSTHDFGLLNETIVAQEPTSTALQASLFALKDSIDKVPGNTDVTLTKGTTTTVDWPLKVNGVDAKVKAYQARGWFGEIVFLANPQNPLVLKVKANAMPDDSMLNGLLDYEITELRDLQE